MKILVFAPNSEIWVHAFPEALAVEALQQEGHEIVYVSCGTAFSEFCVPMDMHRLTPDSTSEEKSAVCRSCSANAAILRGQFRFPGYSLAERLGEDERSTADTLLGGITRDNFLDFSLDGIPLGRYSVYEFVLRHKLQELRLDDRLWKECRIGLRNCIYTHLALRRILSEERPDRLVVYNALYSVNHIAGAIARSKGVAVYFVHAGGNIAHRLQKLMIGRGQNVRYYEDAIERWPAFRGRPCPPMLMAEITDHFLELLSGRSGFVYSAPKVAGANDVRSLFGIPPGSRVVTAVMSSPDEMLAARTVDAKQLPANLLFATQIEWIKAVIAFVAARPGLFLIVRVHPREFPNRREGLKSQHALKLEEALQALPSNARVNWPDQNVSLYALAEETGVFLNVHSSAGKEMSVLGLPVVLYSDSLALYPSGINYVGLTQEQYFAQIEQALAAGWNAAHIREAYRWLAVEYGYGLLDISDSYVQRETMRPDLPQRVLNRAMRFFDPKHREKSDCRRRAGRLAAGRLVNSIIAGGKASVLDAADPARLGSATEAEETAALRVEMRRIISALYGAEAQSPSGSLHASLHRFAHDSSP
ncbi:MAG: capsule biosynthesis protein [Candidatus Parcubacteria bacterium]|nr:capsule biosynthesis protein [Burkholderiales bacterium]